MVLVVLYFTENVKQKYAHVPFQILMVQKQLAQQTQILAIYRIFESINFKNCNFELFISVYLISGRMEQWALFRVSFKLLRHVKKCKTELTNIQAFPIMIINRVRRVIPRLREVLTHLNFLNCFKLGRLLMRQ